MHVLYIVKSHVCYINKYYCSTLLYRPIIRYSIVKEATIRIAKITIRFSTSSYHVCSNATALAHPHRNMWPNMTSQVCGDTMYTNVIHELMP